MNAENLIYYPDTQPGVSRRRCGRGFSYFDTSGHLIRNQHERDRLNRLAVPPAYDDVWMCPVPNGHLQATGRDTKGRKQYLYHPDWTEARAEAKFDGLVEFGRSLPRLRRRVRQDLDENVGAREFAIAAAVTLIDRTGLRVGNPQYLKENGSRGALTLRGDHVALSGNRIDLQYRAKGGQVVSRKMTDAVLARVLGEINDLPGATLLSWTDDQGNPQALSSETLNGYLADITGIEGVTAKTFRTWVGTCVAFTTAEAGGATIKEMAEAAAQRLHNTPVVARNSYIHPDVIALAGRPAPRIIPDERDGLRVAEQRLLGFLERL